MEYMSKKQEEAYPSSGNSGSIMDLIASQEFQNPDKVDPYMNRDTTNATVSGLQSGGVSGALTSGGLASMLGSGGMAGGGPYALAGGLILSQIEAAQKAKAAAEQERINNEKLMQRNMLAQYNSNANQSYDV